MTHLINEERLKSHLEELGYIGAEEKHGRTRIAYTPEYNVGRDLVKSWMDEAGLATSVDTVGNLFGVKKGKSNKVILIGSHIDTVPEAGIYDGCLGVLGAIEAIQTLNERHIELDHTIKIAAWIDEEGTAIGGLFGSRAYSGLPIDESFKNRFDQYDMTMDKFESAKSNDDVDYYLELHIEQGGILDDKKISIGIVQAIVAIFRWTVNMKGQANHAGTTPMYLRDDAMLKTAKFVSRYDELVRQHEGMVGTIGKIRAFPGTFNIIPERVKFSCEMRSVNVEDMNEVWQQMLDEFGDVIEYQQDFKQDAVVMDDKVKQSIKSAAEKLGLSCMDINSGAGHDTQSIASVTRPGMLFVPSVHGISHSPKEYTTWKDCANGANVLMHTVCNLDLL